MDLIFLANRSDSSFPWRGVVALGLRGSIPGVEGSVGTSVRFVTLADRHSALALTRTIGGGGDCDCGSESVVVATVKGGKLQQRGAFETAQPCECEYNQD